MCSFGTSTVGYVVKVGDLVTYNSLEILERFIGLIIEVGEYPGNADIKVLWTHEKVALTQKSSHLKVINESR